MNLQTLPQPSLRKLSRSAPAPAALARESDAYEGHAHHSRPQRADQAHSHDEYLAARALVEAYGTDSLAPFAVRPDKSFYFASGGLIAYRVIGRMAIVSGDPVAPAAGAPRVLEGFLAMAARQRWRVVLWGASGAYLDAYRRLGFRAMCAGEEAFVDPSRFTLVGRSVRKLRQSVHRLERRGWTATAVRDEEIDAHLRAEIASVEAQWRRAQPRLIGFAMGFGAFEPEPRADDLYLLGRSPEKELRAVMRFAAHCGRLSLDSMRRVGETLNGLNEALVSRALETARGCGVTEVSLNYAGLGHLVREDAPAALTQAQRSIALRVLAPHFQMERLVNFNAKFSPEWRPRYLLCRSRAAVPGAMVRVLQAEGYLPALPAKVNTRGAR